LIGVACNVRVAALKWVALIASALNDWVVGPIDIKAGASEEKKGTGRRVIFMAVSQHIRVKRVRGGGGGESISLFYSFLKLVFDWKIRGRRRKGEDEREQEKKFSLKKNQKPFEGEGMLGVACFRKNGYRLSVVQSKRRS